VDGAGCWVGGGCSCLRGFPSALMQSDRVLWVGMELNGRGAPQVIHTPCNYIDHTAREALYLHTGLETGRQARKKTDWIVDSTVAVTVNYVVYATITKIEFNQSGQCIFSLQLCKRPAVPCASVWWLVLLPQFILIILFVKMKSLRRLSLTSVPTAISHACSPP
jgi:hypothetical protein